MPKVLGGCRTVFREVVFALERFIGESRDKMVSGQDHPSGTDPLVSRRFTRARYSIRTSGAYKEAVAVEPPSRTARRTRDSLHRRRPGKTCGSIRAPTPRPPRSTSRHQGLSRCRGYAPRRVFPDRRQVGRHEKAYSSSPASLAYGFPSGTPACYPAGRASPRYPSGPSLPKPPIAL